MNGCFKNKNGKNWGGDVDRIEEDELERKKARQQTKEEKEK